MARPRLGKEPSVKQHVVMPAELISKIDDWRFARRIGSRGEAIRQMILIALPDPNNWAAIADTVSKQSASQSIDDRIAGARAICDENTAGDLECMRKLGLA